MTDKLGDKLANLLAQYLVHWGPVPWRSDLKAAHVVPSMELGRAVLALSAIETDSRVIYRKVHVANLDRRQAIKEFNISWLAEEAEHGRALHFLAGKLGVAALPPDRTVRKSARSGLAWPLLTASRTFGTAMEATYLTLGTMQEYVALTTYRKLADIIGDPDAALVLRRIAAQEGRHMHFYRGAAMAFLANRRDAYVASRVLTKLWRPPGMDLLGKSLWLESFGPLLEDRDYCERLLQMDPMIQQIPGFDDCHLMTQFLCYNGYLTPTATTPVKSLALDH